MKLEVEARRPLPGQRDAHWNAPSGELLSGLLNGLLSGVRNAQLSGPTGGSPVGQLDGRLGRMDGTADEEGWSAYSSRTVAHHP